MKLIFRIAFRNLIRQKRRNILLGLGISVGMVILVLSSSFAEGLSDIVMNTFLADFTGHIEISIQERTKVKGEIARDRFFFEKLIKENIPTFKKIDENITAWTRVVGNGVGDNMVLSGISKEKIMDEKSSIQVVEGSVEKFISGKNKAMLYRNKAEDLNVKVGDFVTTRFQGIYGQAEILKLEVVALLKPESFFLDLAVYVNLDDLKISLGYDPHEASKIKIILENPLKAKKYSKILRSSLKPKIAALPLLINNQSLMALAGNLKKIDFNQEDDHKPSFDLSLLPSISKKTLGLSKNTIDTFGLKEGQIVEASYFPKYHSTKKVRLKIKAVKTPKKNISYGLVSPELLYELYYPFIPRDLSDGENDLLKKIDQEYPDLFLKSWILMEQSDSTEAINVKFAHLNKKKWQGQALDVRTMYETGSQFLEMEAAIKSITYFAFIIIGLIVLVGVINTFNLSIRERTREIGTIRAIGMSRKNVLGSFLMEAGILSFFACLAGILISFIVIFFLSMFDFGTENYFSFFLRDGHLHFLVSFISLLIYTFLIVLVTTLSAFFPSLKAAKLKPSEALGHYG